MIPGTPDWGNKVICGYTGCTLQTFVKHYESAIFLVLVLVVIELYESRESSSTSVFFFSLNKIPV